MTPLAAIRCAVLRKTVKVILLAYNDLCNSKPPCEETPPTEDVRRNQIVTTILDNKSKYQYTPIVTTENGQIDEAGKTIGRIDIGIYYSGDGFRQECLSFECKRYVAENSGLSSVEKTFYQEGLQRYEIRKYPCDTGFGGMIAFCESGDYYTLKDNILQVITKHAADTVNDDSKTYLHDFVYSFGINDCKGNAIRMIGILLDFTKR